MSVGQSFGRGDLAHVASTINICVYIYIVFGSVLIKNYTGNPYLLIAPELLTVRSKRICPESCFLFSRQ